MLQVKTKIGISKIHGIGLFADQFIPKGTVTFLYIPWYDISFSKKDFDKMTNVAKEQMLWFTYFNKKLDKFILCGDNQRFINHSNNPKKINIESTPDKDVALRDIQIGEELLCDYNKFDDTYFERMGYKKENLK